jgi:hypothetical protein
MSKESATILPLRFAYRHFQTDGKLQNMFEALEQIDVRRVCLGLTEPDLDGLVLDRSEIADRVARTKAVIARLRRRGISADLILPGPANLRPNDPAHKRYLKSIYARAADIPVRTIWVDDTTSGKKYQYPRSSFLNCFQTIRRTVHKCSPRTRIGLIADAPQRYGQYAVTAGEIAKTLAGKHQLLLAQTQPFNRDYNRTDILQTAQTIATVIAQTGSLSSLELFGAADYSYASPFHKSAEAQQMQTNLNVLYGLKGMLINCFDKIGTAPAAENLYLQMRQNRLDLLNKLTKLLTNASGPTGIRVVIPDLTNAKPATGGKSKWQDNCWPILLWRMGLPVTIVTTGSVKPTDGTNAPYVLIGRTPAYLTRRQLNHIFTNGVLLDASAAEMIQSMKLPGLIGVKVAGPLKNVQTEIISDQTLAAPYYGHNTILNGDMEPGDFRCLRPFHRNARAITTLNLKNHRPNTNGMTAFDNTDHNHRCVILPYSISSSAQAAPLLCIERQRHFREVFAWLLRKRLDCFVENTPDLVPFYIPLGKRHRTIVALLNVGFDWAIDARIRLSRIGFTVKRVRELNEQGRLVSYRDLRLRTCCDYQYIDLTSDVAVPPMQMTILLLDG